MKKDNGFIKNLSGKKNLNLLSVTDIYSLFEAKRAPEFYFEGECHSPWEMVYVIDGSVGITADDKIYTLSKGDIIFHKPMEFHKIWSAEGTSPSVLICAFDLKGNLSHRLGGVYHLTDETKNIMESMLNDLYSEFTELPKEHINFFDVIDKSKTTMQIILNKLELILLYLSRTDNHEQSSYPNEMMNLYTRIVEILEEHIYDKITISQISKMCNVSPSTIKNCFTKFAGCGVHKYHLNIKIRTAIDLLKSGMSVNEASDTLQFANPNYFSYVFKRETGMCASDFKKL